MNRSNMATRCPAARYLGPVVAIDEELIERRHADLVRTPGESTPGVLWDITSICRLRLDRFEAVPQYYYRSNADVRLENGDVRRVMVYRMTRYSIREHDRNPQIGRFSRDYAAACAVGLREAGLPVHPLYAAHLDKATR